MRKQNIFLITHFEYSEIIPVVLKHEKFEDNVYERDNCKYVRCVETNCEYEFIDYLTKEDCIRYFEQR